MTAPNTPSVSTWFVLVTQMPDDAAVRMRILRMLDAMGCGILRDGVFVLPGSTSVEQGLERLGKHITASGGVHHFLRIQSDEAQAKSFERLFDRSARYVELIKTVAAMRGGFGIADPTALSRMLIRQKRDFEAISSLDFFPGESRARAAQAIASAEADIRKVLFPASKGLSASQQLRTREKFFHRIWVTQKPLWVDRLACAWLIRRFIDAEAKIVCAERGAASPETVVTFGFDGAMFNNSASQVTYEVLLDAFGLNKNTALKRIASIVHVLDIGGAPVPEAAGIEAILQGALRRASDETSLLAEAENTFDLLYDTYFQSPGDAPTGKGG